MAIYEVKLKNRRVVAQDTMAFVFEKPKNFTFKAGQVGKFTLNSPPETDAEGNSRLFTITSPPFADDLEIATRMRKTAFKNSLAKLPLGTTLQLNAPMGSFNLHNNRDVPAVFIAGGIGITPARSIALQAAHDKLPQKLYLFYSNHTPETTAFLDELQAIQNPNFKLVATMTHMSNSKKPWKGETGHVDTKMLQKYIPDLAKPIYYISGPASMVSEVHKTLVAGGLDEDKIRTEEFSGY